MNLNAFRVRRLILPIDSHGRQYINMLLVLVRTLARGGSNRKFLGGVAPSAEGASRGAEGVGYGERVSASPLEVGPGRGMGPFPLKFFEFVPRNGEISCIPTYC